MSRRFPSTGRRMPRPSLVTGGAGFIGSHLALHLRAHAAAPVRALDNLTRPRLAIDALRSAGVDAVRGDIRELSDLRRAMAGCDTVYHLAAKATVMDCERAPEEAHAVNVEGTRNVLAVARDVGVRRVVIASSREVYGDPDTIPVAETAPLRPKNTYGRSKVAAETLATSVAGDGIEVTLLRIANAFGPGDTDRVVPRFLAQARAGRPLTVHGGDQIIDFVWVGDVVDAFVRAGRGPHLAGGTNIGSGMGVTVREAARRVVAACGTHSAVHIEPARSVDVSRFVADVTRAKRELGLRTPAAPLEELPRLLA